MKWERVFLLSYVGATLFAEPPRQIPDDLRNEYTLGDKIPVLEWYLDHSYPPSEPRIYTKNQIDMWAEKAIRKEENYYGKTDTWLYQAFEAFPIIDKSVAIVGSAEPWYESVVLAYGGIPITIEYNKIVTDDPRLMILTVEEYEKNPMSFDVVLSISSTEHDGLGRYGDPLNPRGDLDFMNKVKDHMLNPGGVLMLAVPFGRDCLVWNAHRIYGPLRFSLLTKGWDVLGAFGFDPRAIYNKLGDSSYQPVFVLRPR